MALTTNKAETAMLIRKPVAEVFQAFVDPTITSKFWFTKSSGHLIEEQNVTWTWKMYNHSVPVKVVQLIADRLIVIEWGKYDKQTTVNFDFQALNENQTFITIINFGFQGSESEIIKNIIDSTGGFTWVLAGLKAYLEHSIQLHLIEDRFPKGK